LSEINKFKNKIERKKKGFKLIKFFFSDFAKYPNYQNIITNLDDEVGIIFREYHLASDEKIELAKKIKNNIKNTHQKNRKILIIGKDYQLFKKIKADGIHFSDFDFRKRLIGEFLLKTKKNARRKIIFSISCHSEKSINKAIRLKPDIIFLSPIFKTNTHLETKPIGIKKFLEIRSRLKKLDNNQALILPLGGINKRNIRFVNKNNLAGFAATQLFIKNL
jgi:thiamine monophosphate synthase